jgi:excisionase family DNA binding protein
MSDPLLTATELAERLKVAPSTVEDWGRQGRIPRVQLTPRTIRYDLAAVMRALRQKRRAKPQANAAVSKVEERRCV